MRPALEYELRYHTLFVHDQRRAAWVTKGDSGVIYGQGEAGAGWVRLDRRSASALQRPPEEKAFWKGVLR